MKSVAGLLSGGEHFRTMQSLSVFSVLLGYLLVSVLLDVAVVASSMVYCRGAAIVADVRPRPGFPLSLGDLGDLGDQKCFYQWNSEKRK